MIAGARHDFDNSVAAFLQIQPSAADTFFNVIAEVNFTNPYVSKFRIFIQSAKGVAAFFECVFLHCR